MRAEQNKKNMKKYHYGEEREIKVRMELKYTHTYVPQNIYRIYIL